MEGQATVKARGGAGEHRGGRVERRDGGSRGKGWVVDSLREDRGRRSSGEHGGRTGSRRQAVGGTAGVGWAGWGGDECARGVVELGESRMGRGESIGRRGHSGYRVQGGARTIWALISAILAASPSCTASGRYPLSQ